MDLDYNGGDGGFQSGNGGEAEVVPHWQEDDSGGEGGGHTLWGHEGGGAGDAWGIGRVQQEECSVGQVAE